MAKTSKNVLGDQRGRIGKVVGKVIDGVQMYSAHTDAVKNPRSEKQIAHRARFAEAIKLSKAMKGVVKIGFKQTASKQKLISPSNIFVKENKPKISYNKTTGETSVDYEHIVISEGEAPFVLFSGVTFPEALKVTASFNGCNDTPGALADDSVYIAVYSPTLSKCMTGIGKRSDGSVTVTLPSIWAGETVYVWGFVKTSVEEEVNIDDYGITLHPNDCSNSFYIGTGTVTE